MTPKHLTKRKSHFKLQIEIDMQPSAMCTNHIDRHSIEQGTLNNQRDAASNQFHVDVQDHIPHVENNSLVPYQNDDMKEKSSEGDRYLDFCEAIRQLKMVCLVSFYFIRLF